MSTFNFDNRFSDLMEKNKLVTVLILGHMNPDGDAAGSVMGLAHYISISYTRYNVIPYLAGTMDKGPKRFVETDKKFAPFAEPVLPERYLAIVCDTATRERIIGRSYYENAVATLVIDHHASNEGYGTVNHTKISEACAENIFHIVNQEKLSRAAKEAHPNAADYFYLGMLHDTDCFERANSTNLLAANKLLNLGVDHRTINQTRKSQTLEDMLRQGKLLGMAERAKNGRVAYVFLDRSAIKEHGFSYEDIHPIGGILRNCEDIDVGFTMYEEEPDTWRCSFRSDGKTIDVNEILLPFGGGGHKGAAGLRKKTNDPEQLLADILEAIARKML